MRTTVRLPDDVLGELKQRAQKEGVSLTEMLTRTVRRGLQAMIGPAVRRKPFRQRTYDTGVPLFDVTKANALAAQLEDEEIIEKLRQGK